MTTQLTQTEGERIVVEHLGRPDLFKPLIVAIDDALASLRAQLEAAQRERDELRMQIYKRSKK